jgi:hypothetical protein
LLPRRRAGTPQLDFSKIRYGHQRYQLRMQGKEKIWYCSVIRATKEFSGSDHLMRTYNKQVSYDILELKCRSLVLTYGHETDN